jgi:hypothetical protein
MMNLLWLKTFRRCANWADSEERQRPISLLSVTRSDLAWQG